MNFTEIEEALGKAKLVEEEKVSSNSREAAAAQLMDFATSSNNAGNYALGQINKNDSFSKSFNANKRDAPGQEDVLKSLMSRYQLSKEMKGDSKAESLEAMMNDPNSAKAKALAGGYLSAYERAGRKLDPNEVTGRSVKDLVDAYGPLSQVNKDGLDYNQAVAGDSRKFGQERDMFGAKSAEDRRMAAFKSESDMKQKAFEQSGDARLLGLKGNQEKEMLGLKGGQSLAEIGAKGDQDRMTKDIMSGADKVKLAGESPLGTKTTEYKLSKLSGTDKARVDNVRMAYEGVNSMAKALSNGDKTYQLMGDNDFTMAERNFTEALGRMQSGGAINDKEAARFAKMAPKALDNDDIRAKKIAQLQSELGDRFKTLGFAPEEFRIANESFKPPKSGGKELVKSAQAGEATQADRDAMNWVKANSNDPRAKGILEKLKSKGAF